MTVRAVCGDCNNGWMAALEERAQLLFNPMLDGRGRELHREGQRTLAAWALKTTMMLEHAQSVGRRVIPAEEYLHLFTTGEPSERVRIWMTTYAGDMAAYAQMYGADADVVQPDDRGVRDIYGATISFGPIVFQVFGTTVPGLIDKVQIGSPRSLPVHQLWPYRDSFVWPANRGLDNAGLIAFSESIFAELRRLAGNPDEFAP